MKKKILTIKDMIKFVLVKNPWKRNDSHVFHEKNYDEYKMNSTWSWSVSSLFLYQGYNESNSLVIFFIQVQYLIIFDFKISSSF
jgi:hypothetical protein